MRNHGDEHICVINTTNDDFIPLKTDNTEAARNTPPTENEILMEEAHGSNSKTASLKRGF